MKGSELRRIRLDLQMTQVELAEALSVSSNTVARWERDERRITPPMARLVDMVGLAKKVPE